jgi:O-antigen/teichoic acid export membrane protein
MSQSRKVAANTAVQVAGRFVSAILAIFTLSLILRFFGEELQGRYLLAMAFAQFVSTIADFGLGTYLVRAITGQAAVASQGMIFRFYTAVPFYILAVIVSFLMPYDGPTRQAILVALVSAFIISMNNTLVVFYQAKLRMQIPVFAEVLNKIVVYALTAAVIALNWPFLWSVLAVVAGAGVNFFVNFLVGRRALPYSAKADFSSWPAIFKETLPLWVVGVLILIYFRIDTLMLSILPLPSQQNNLVQVG